MATSARLSRLLRNAGRDADHAHIGRIAKPVDDLETLPENVRPHAQPRAFALRQMAIEPPVDDTEDRDHRQRQQHETAGCDRVGNERVEGLVGKILGVIKGVTLLAKGRKPEKKTSVVA